jgi:hypothetical protein
VRTVSELLTGTRDASAACVRALKARDALKG